MRSELDFTHPTLAEDTLGGDMKLMELVLLLCRRTKGLQNKALEYRIVSAGASIVSVFSCAVHPSQRPVHIGDTCS